MLVTRATPSAVRGRLAPYDLVDTGGRGRSRTLDSLLVEGPVLVIGPNATVPEGLDLQIVRTDHTTAAVTARWLGRAHLDWALIRPDRTVWHAGRGRAEVPPLAAARHAAAS
jgi:hypothetical protein